MTPTSSSSSSSTTVDTNSRSVSPNSPIRKRPRLSPDFSSTTLTRTAMQQGCSGEESGHVPLKNGTGTHRDDTYYLTDGSCVLLVEQTLFNVHRTVLSRDSSSFSAMFPLPSGELKAEGASDNNPIILPGDTVSEFKNFLWALYALPHELAEVHTPMADLTRLIDITRISNKYCFKSIETWALDAIQDRINRKPSPILNLLHTHPQHTFTGVAPVTPSESDGQQENTAQLVRLVRLAQMCNHEPLLTTMVGILRRMMSLSLKYAYLAMILADELNLLELRGAAYLEVMQRVVVVARSVSSSGSEEDVKVEGEVDEEGRLIVTPTQRLRLLSGYHRLTTTWERLRASPLAFDHAPSCGATWHQHGCTQSWLEFWKEKTRSDAVLNLGLADVVGRLKAIQKEFDRWGSASYMHHDCRLVAKRSIQDRIKKVEETLSDYFTDEV